MNIKQNLHTHTSYCDGRDTPEEFLNTALKLGFNSIGFSGHSYMSYSPDHSMSLKGTDDYIREINSLKEKYRDKISVFCGIEYDMYSDVPIDAFDYSIGSVHYLNIGEEYVGFDRSQEEVSRVINRYFDGNGMNYAEMYYEMLSKLPLYGDFDIIGHFDLISKHCENIDFFDSESKQYITYVTDALESLRGKIPLFEVNTGAIARGYRTTPYPSIPIIREMKRMGFSAVITSDCHDASRLDCYFDEAAELLKYCGFDEQYVLTENGFIPQKL